MSTGDVAIGKWYGANHYSTYYGYNGEISKVRLYNRVLTAAEVKNAYSGQAVPYQYTKGKTNYTSDFSSDVDGWLWSYGATVADSSNTGGQTNNLKYTTNTGNYYKRTYYNSNYAYSTTDSHKARISFNIYIPSGNSHLVGYRVYMGGWLTSAVTPTANTWTSVVLDNVSVGSSLEIYYTNSSGATTFDDGGGDIVYLRDVKIETLGNVAEYLPTSIGATCWLDTSGNSLHGTTTTATQTHQNIFGANVGIGTASPDQSLDVKGNIIGTSDSYTKLLIE